MSDFVARPPSGGHRNTGPPGSGALPVLMLSVLAATLLVGVIFMALLMTEGDGAAAPAQPAGATGAGEDRALLRVTFEGDGSGEIEFDPGTTSCSRNCEKRFPTGVRLTVTARAADDSTFTGWSHACRGKRRCSFVLDDNRSLTVAFEDKVVQRRTKQQVRPECEGLLPGEINPACSGDRASEQITRSDCLDGRDNDGDGLTDSAQDPSCDDGPLESGRSGAPPAPPPPSRSAGDCADGRDNDGDGLTDTKQDPDCLEGDTESGSTARGGASARPRAVSDCGDGRDNDGDGLIDAAQDPGCEKDRSEAD